MAKDITTLNNFWKRWWYQQGTYFKFIWKSFLSFLSHFPMGYINLFIQLFIFVISLPIFFGHALEFWIASALIIKPTMEDVGSIPDQQGRSIVAKAQVRAIEDYKEASKIVFTFLLGVITTVITLYLTTQVFKTP